MNDFLGYHLADLIDIGMVNANWTSENGSTAKLPITSKTSVTVLEKAAFIVRAELGAKNVRVKVQECLLAGIY